MALLSRSGPGTVGEEDQGKLAFGVDPQERFRRSPNARSSFPENTCPNDDSSLGVSSRARIVPDVPGRYIRLAENGIV